MLLASSFGRDFDLNTHRTFRITNFTVVVDRREADSPIIPYCKAFFGLAVQDKAAFQYVLRHTAFPAGLAS